MWILLVFGAIFAAIALLLLAVTAGAAARAKQTTARLEEIGARIAAAEPEAKPIDVRLPEVFSALPWLDGLLRKADVGPRLRLLLRQADMPWTAGRLLLLCTLLGLAFFFLVNLRTRAAALSLLLGLAASSLPIFYVLHRRKRRFDRIRSLLPDAIDLMVAGIRAGHSFSSALGMVSRESPEPVRGEFRQTFEEQNFGLDFRTAMANLERRVPVHDIRIINAAVLIQKDTGGNLTEILDKVAYLIREDFRLQRQVGVHTAQGRLTGYILSALPLLLGIGLYLLNPDAMSLLWTRPIGLKMLYGSAISTTVGMLLIRKIVSIRV